MRRALVVLSAFCVLPCCFVRAEPLAENQGRFGVITGDVGLLSQGAVDWIEPHEGLPLEPGDHIRTGEDGHAELILGENVLWMLEPHTEVVTEHMETNVGRFSLISGDLIGKVDSQRTAGTVQRWEFNTPAAVVAIRGTEFALEFSKPREGRVAVFEGTVDLQPAETADGLQPTVQVDAGHEAFAPRGRPLQLLTRYSPAIKTLEALRPALRRRQKAIQDTWSPYTPAVRSDLRQKFVAPAPKTHAHPHPVLKRRPRPADTPPS